MATLSPWLALKLKHNRSINIHGGKVGNVPGDLALEFFNMRAKDVLHALHGNLTSTSIKRVGRSLQGFNDTMDAYVNGLGHYFGKPSISKPSLKKDINMIVTHKVTSYVYDNKYCQKKNKNWENRECFWTSLVYIICLNSRREKTACSGELSKLPDKIPEVVILHTSGKMMSAAECSQEISANLIEQVFSFSSRKPCATVAKSLVDILNPVFQSNFKTLFETAMTESHNLSLKESSKDKSKSLEAILKETTTSVLSCTQQNDTYLTVILSSKSRIKWENKTETAVWKL
ncbi:unnamed protein product [Mytilus edulis]|uniref:Uncharacterized protein n=1 Tax=Mytilus edulis TaxID=6550 RepID=A0A8S3V5E2_MYTED|nr:unnamed protein product [Mytilus edulis]